MTQPQNASALLVDAMASVTADASVSAILSPQSRIMVITVQSAVDGVIGDVVKDAVQTMSNEVMALIGESCTQAVGAVVEAWPFIGQVFGAAMMVVDDITGKEAQKEAQEQARHEACQALESACAPVGSAGATVMPCDIFARYLPSDIEELQLHRFNSSAGDVESMNLRPTLGETIIRVTEDWTNGHRAPLMAIYSAIQLSPTLLRMYGMRRDTAWKGDLSPQRRALHKKVRVAIESTRYHEPRRSTDGGESLWPVKLDMIADDIAQGHLTPQSMAWLLGRYMSAKGAQPGVCIRTAPARAAALGKLVNDWRETLNPWYSGARATEQAEIEARAAEIAKGIGEERAQVPLKFRKRITFKLQTPREIRRNRKRYIVGTAALGVFAIGSKFLGWL